MGRNMTRRAAAVLLATAACLPASAFAQRRGGGEEIMVFAVEVPVQVIVHGAPVRGLTAANFEIVEGREARELTGFDVIDLAADAAAPPASGRRHILLLFDLANSDPTALMNARQAAKTFVQESFHPSDLVAVGTYSVRGARLVLGFTPDRAQLGVALDTLGLLDAQDRVAASEPLQLMLGAAEGGARAAVGGAVESRAGLAMEELRDQLEALQAVERQDELNQVLAFTDGMEALGSLMDSVAGRKYVVLLSLGFDLNLLTGTSGVEEAAEDREAALSGEYWRVDQQERYGDTRGRNALEDMLDAFRRSDCTIHTVDIRGLGGSALSSRREALFTMARDTGGSFHENFGNPRDAMDQMLEETSVTYVLTFQPKDVKPDGRFHRIKVRLKNAPPGAELVHRPGYYAPLPWSERPEEARMLHTTQLLVAGEPGGELTAGAVVAPFRTAGERAHVPVILEVDGASILENAAGGRVDLALYAYAFDQEGQLLDFVAQNVGLDLNQVREPLQRAPFKFVGDLLLPAGAYRVRLLAQTPATGRYWVGEVELEIPEGSSPALLSPLFPEPMTQGLVARANTSAEKTRGLAFPFTIGEEFFLPDALPVLADSGKHRVVVPAYGVPAGDLDVEATLVDMGRGAEHPARVTLAQRLPGQAPGLEQLVLEVAPGKVPAGSYTLRVAVSQGSTRLASATAVRVSG